MLWKFLVVKLQKTQRELQKIATKWWQCTCTIENIWSNIWAWVKMWDHMKNGIFTRYSILVWLFENFHLNECVFTGMCKVLLSKQCNRQWLDIFTQIKNIFSYLLPPSELFNRLFRSKIMRTLQEHCTPPPLYTENNCMASWSFVI